MKITVKIINNNKEIIANCPELDINCYGANKDEAIRRIKSVITFYINSARELGLDVEDVNEINVEGKSNNPNLNEPEISLKNSIN